MDNMDLKGAHVLLTGSSGFLGKRVLSRLVDEGVRVTTISRGDATIQGSLLDQVTHGRIVSGGPYDAVIHLAAAGVDPKTTEREVLEVNVVGVQMLLQTLTSMPACPVVVTGSWTEYGLPTGSVMSESQVCHPRSTYGISKLGATLLALAWSEKNDRPLAVLRLFSLYGPDERPDRLFPTLARAVGGEVVRLNDPEQIRDFVHVDDAVESIIRAISQTGIAQLVNVGTGRGYRIGEIVDLLSLKYGKKIDVIWNPQKLLPWSVPSAVADIERCRTVLGWTPSSEINFSVFD